MKDNNLYKFFRVLGALRHLALSYIRARLDRLTPRQRLRLVALLFVLFLIADICFILRGFRGKDVALPEIEHMVPVSVSILPTDSIDPIKSYDHE